MFHHATLLLLLIYSVIMRRQLLKIEDRIDEQNITPSDFGVFITNIPIKKSKDEFEEHMKKIIPHTEIAYINYCYTIEEYVKLIRKEQRLSE